LLGSDPVNRRESALEHVIAAAELAGALQRDHVHGLLHDAEQRRIAALVSADGAGLRLGDVAANLAILNPGLEFEDRLREAAGVLVAGTEEMEGDPLRRFSSEAREAGELGDERFEERARVLHRG